MYVCICNAVTDKQIGHAVRSGATTMRDIKHQLAVSSQCGKCASCARACLYKHLNEKYQHEGDVIAITQVA